MRWGSDLACYAGSLLARLWLTLAAALCAAGGIAVETPAAASAGTFEVDACTPYTNGSGVFQHAAEFGINTSDGCLANARSDTGLGIVTAGNKVPAGQVGRWGTTAPSGLTIIAAVIPSMTSIGINTGHGWGGGFFWANGGAGAEVFLTL